MTPAATLTRYLEARKWRGERLFPQKFPKDLRKLVALLDSLIHATALMYAKDASRRKIFDHFAKPEHLGSETLLRNAMVLEAQKRLKAYDDSAWLFKTIYGYGDPEGDYSLRAPEVSTQEHDENENVFNSAATREEESEEISPDEMLTP